jgi:hypothetical protein
MAKKTKKKPISVASRKAKGRRLQQKIAEYISKTINIPVQKDGDIESRPMGQSGRDVILRGKAKELFIFHGIECKARESLNIWQALSQAEEHGGKPIVFFKRNRSETYAVLKADDFFDLYELALKEIIDGKERDKTKCDKD